MMAGLLLVSCASKETRLSIQSLQKENQNLKNEIAKLQTEVNGLTNDMLVVQTRVENQALWSQQPSRPVQAPTPQKTAKRKPSFESSFFSEFGEDIQFSDDEPAVKFTNQDLSPTQKPKAGFTEKTLVEAPKKAAVDSGIEDPQIVASYNKGYKTFQDRSFRETIQLMTEFLKKYPSHSYADNAAFWRGESYYQLKEYSKAKADFDLILKDYPQGNKVPDALLRSGICSLKLSKPETAKTAFDLLIQKYPESVAAKRAKATLGEMQ